MTKIFERNQNIIYQREAGSLTREILSEALEDDMTRYEQDKMWRDMCILAEKNSIFANELDKLIVLYRLCKDE